MSSRPGIAADSVYAEANPFRSAQDSQRALVALQLHRRRENDLRNATSTREDVMNAGVETGSASHD